MHLVPDNISRHRNVFDVLKERGFIEQTTHDQEIRDLLGKESVRFYIGFDPTADSLHVGHFIQIIIMMIMQKYGHTPIALIGGGTTMIGDPSGRTDMRQMMTAEMIRENGLFFEGLFRRFLAFDEDFEHTPSGSILGKGSISKEPAGGKTIGINNASWLLSLNYIEFIRDIGRHFSVNNMLRADCFKQRLEKGLSFLEFNYMLMQAYDFMVLARDVGCHMQCGGNDQWSNIIAGVDLTRRVLNKQVYGMTFALLTTSEGIKMGKTQKGAVWLDPDKTSPYEFFQYWRNVEDADVNKCLRMLTFLPMEEVDRLSALQGEALNEAKEKLAFEVTRLVHGQEEADKAREAAQALFGGGSDLDNVPTTLLDRKDFEGEGLGAASLLRACGLAASNSEAFRIIQQGGLTIEGEKVEDPRAFVRLDQFQDDFLLLRKGKKTFHRVKLQ